MATVKIASLLLKTLAKPLAVQLKNQAREHPTFRQLTIKLAQQLHKREMNMRINLLGDKISASHIKPLNEAKAIDQGANFISEAFLFGFACSLIGAETLRSSRKESNRRDLVKERIEELEQRVVEAVEKEQKLQSLLSETVTHLNRLEGITGEIVEIGLRGGWMPQASSDAWRARSSLPPIEREGENEMLDGSVLKELLRGMN